MKSTNRYLFYAIIVLVLAVVLLAGCQRTRGISSEEREAQLLQVASEYGVDQDMDKARDSLDKLGVPNVRQFVALVTERYIQAGQDEAATENLVRLSRDLDIATNLIARYGKMMLTLPEIRSTTQPSAALTNSSEPTATATLPAAASPTSMPTETALPLPTDTPLPPAATPTPTSGVPYVRSSAVVNLRAGPGTNHPVVGQMRVGDELSVIARNPAGTWWQVCCAAEQYAWVSAAVVEAMGNTQSVSQAASIPTPPPQVTPTPVPPTPTPKPSIDFRIVEQRMLSNIENEGSFDGNSLHCGGGHTIYVRVLDAASNPLNGIVVKGIYFGDLPVTGTKGAGGTSEDLYKGGGDELIIDRDTSGRTYSSERTRPLVNRTRDIPFSDFIAGGYCRDDADCQQKVNNNQLCEGHYSYNVIFQRTW